MKVLGGASKRNYGVDLLRVLAMFFVVLHHQTMHCLDVSAAYSVKNIAMYFLEAVSICGVNIFAIISGYVGVDTKYKVSNVVYLWVQVFFYSVVFILLFKIVAPEQVGISRILTYCAPTLTGAYWYFNAYLVMFLFVPVLKIALQKLERRQMKFVLCALLTVAAVSMIKAFYNDFTGSDAGDYLYANWGYSSVWLGVLYLLGGYIKKYNVPEEFKEKHPKFKNGMWLLVFFAGAVAILLTKFGSMFLAERFMGKMISGDAFYGYISPLVVLSSVSLLMFFSQLKIQKSKLLDFFSKTSFGVFLVHTNAFVAFLMSGIPFAAFMELNVFLSLLVIIGLALAIYVASSVVDWLRLLLFNVLKVKERLWKLEKKVFSIQQD